MIPTDITYTAAFSAGLLSFLSPCVLPLVPIYLGYLTGAGAGNRDIQVEQSRLFTLAHGGAFVFGFSLIFIVLGAGFGVFGDFLTDNLDWVLRIGGILVIIMGLHLIGVIKIPFLYMEKRMEYQHGGNPNVFSSMLIGATFGAGWTPCVGPILGGILTLAALQGDALQGASLLTVYSLGLGVPFLIAAIGLGQASRFIRKMGPYLRYIEIASGVLLVFVGVLIFSNYLSVINSYFIQFTPAWLFERL
jgi:cytochrome c-type biogenesis protein